MEPPQLVRVGFVRRPLGLRGEVEVEALTHRADRFHAGLSLHAGPVSRVVEAVRPSRGGVALKLSGVDDRGSAEKLRGCYLEVDLEQVEPLPVGSFYHWQLVGLQVFDTAGASLGVLSEVLEYPANEVFVVSGPSAPVLVPALFSVVREVDLPGGRMVVEMPSEEVVR